MGVLKIYFSKIYLICMIGWIKMSKRVKARESITKLFVHRVSVYLKDNETLNNTYKVWVEFTNNTVKTESPGFTDCLQGRSKLHTPKYLCLRN